MNFFLKKINIYLAKCFLTRFLQIVFVFSLIIFLINFIEAIDKTSNENVSIFIVAFMAFLNIPDFLNEIVPSLILFAAMMTFFFLSIKSEITIMRSCGYSLWHISLPIAMSAFALGVFWVLVFSPFSIKMIQKFNSLEAEYVKKELREVIESGSGIWIKQINQDKPEEEILIQAKKVYKQMLELNAASVWFIDKNGEFYKKIDVKRMYLKDGYWLLKDSTINDFETLNKNVKSLTITTNLKPDFVINKVVSNFENVKLFSIYGLPKLISSLEGAGFQSAKFKVYLNRLITLPILFVAMVLIACFFGINNFRNQNTALMLFMGMVCGLGLYISLSFISALGSSRIIPIFTSTWVVTFICLAIGILLIYKKENA